MTRTREFLAVAAITAAALGSAAVPAVADNHIPVAPASVTALDSHRPLTPQDNHTPVVPQGVHAQMSPADSHRP
ncbi:hypothetical protein ACFU7T_19840 [Streptomyces sp. NPDC057555]|uniref:hypothetical protein n=1 Tax=Streptomyces sp. NPDC057555 TaxID=3346166 RepID=UPI0036CF3890